MYALLDFTQHLGSVTTDALMRIFRVISFPLVLLWRLIKKCGELLFRCFCYFICPAEIERHRYYRAVRRSLKNLKTTLRRNPRMVPAAARYYIRKNNAAYRFRLRYLLYWLAPLCSLIAVAAVFSAVHSQTLALKVTLDSAPVGYVLSEEDFLAAAEKVNGIMSAGKKKNVVSGIGYEFAYVDISDISSVSELSSAILEKRGGGLEYACGVYIDGELFAVAQNQATAKKLMRAELDKMSEGTEGYLICFHQDISYEEGYYPGDVILNGEEFAERLAKAEASTLTLKVLRTEVIKETVPYESVEVQSNMLYIGTSRKLSSGKDGLAQVTNLVTYIDGKSVSSEEVSRVTLKESVAERKQVGTKALDASYSSVSMGGVFLWPIVGAYGINSDYGYRWGKLHAGMDLGMGGAAGTSLGKSVVAVAAGRITTATYHSAYGYYIIIDHGNGLSTLYAHLYPNSFTIAAGDYVAAGQPIAKVGSSGNSTGPHLHFEVRVNGTKVNPRPYLGI